MKRLFLLLVITVITSINVFGQAIPKQIDYQGVLKTSTGTIVADGNYQLTFRIYNNPTGGSALWSEVQTVAVANGVFSAHLGSVTPITTVPFDRIHFLGITIESDPELLPRTTLKPSPYSFMAMDVLDNSVTAEKTLDEAGYNYDNTGDPNQLYPLTASGQPFTSVTLDAPANGFAFVYAQAEVFITHTSGTFDNVILKVSQTAGDVTTPSYGVSLVRIPSAWPTSGSYQVVHAVSISAVFTVTSGTNTFYLNGYTSSGSETGLLVPEITVIYVPTRYGTGANMNLKNQFISGQNSFTGN